MTVLITKTGGVILLLFLILLKIPNDVFAEEIQEVKIDTLGKILLNKKTNEFNFLYMDNEHEVSHPIIIKDRKTFETLNKLNNKWVRVSGKTKWIKEIFIELPRYLAKLEIEELQEFQLAELKVFRFAKRTSIAEIDYRAVDKAKRNSASRGGIPISDEAANNLIASAGIVMGIAIGPISLIPAGIFGLKTLLLDD